MREILKLGGSKTDKATAKEYAKVLTTMVPADWIATSVPYVSEVRAVVNTVLYACQLDATASKTFNSIACLCEEVVAEDAATAEGEDGSDEGVSAAAAGGGVQGFLDSAPGLGDLVGLMGSAEGVDVNADEACDSAAFRVEEAVSSMAGGGRARRSQRGMRDGQRSSAGRAKKGTTVDYLEGEGEEDYNSEEKEESECDLEKTLVEEEEEEEEEVGHEENADLQVVAPEVIKLDM
jgi:hypothetical protein